MQSVSFPNQPVYSQPLPRTGQQSSFDRYGNYGVYGTYGNYGNYGGYGTYYPQSQEDDSVVETTKTAGKAVLLQAMAIGLQKMSNILSNKLVAGEEFTSEQNVINTASDMVRKNNLNVHVGLISENNKNLYAANYGNPQEFDIVAKGQNAFYSDELKLAVAPKSKPSMILHELGHAINAKGAFTKLLQQSRRYATYAPAALLVANKLTKNPNSKEKSFVEKHAGILGFCAFLPTIVEEGLASLRGVNAAKRRLGNIPALNILRKNYALALGTYILSGIGLGIAAKQTMDEN